MRNPSYRSLLPAVLLILLPLGGALPGARAETAEERGLAIAAEAQRRDAGWGDGQAGMRMVLRNRHGEESTREVRSSFLEVEGDGDKSLTVFDRPRDVKGTAFLSFTHPTEPDDQWLFLPALKRVKRIASANKSGPFMGSEFAYEDLTSQELEKYRYKWLRDEKLDGRATMVIERYPRYEHSGYTRQVVWIDAERYQPLRTEFYDRKDALLKTLQFSDYQQHLERYWRANRLHMVNHQTGKSTVLEWSDYRLRTGLTAADFDRNALKRVR